MTSLMYPFLKVGFIDIPLAGGAYVNNIFLKIISNQFDSSDLEEKSIKFGVHTGLSEFEMHMGSRLLEYFTFAFVRNTYDWLFARFSFSAERPMHSDHLRCSKISFEEYVLAEGISVPVRLQHSLLRGKSQRVTHIAESRKLGPVLSNILFELGVDLENPVNTPTELLSLYRNKYTDRMVDHVANVYAEDIEAFSFTFDN